MMMMVIMMLIKMTMMPGSDLDNRILSQGHDDDDDDDEDEDDAEV